MQAHFFLFKERCQIFMALQYFFKIESKGNLLAVVNYRPGKSITKGLTINEKGEEWFEIASLRAKDGLSYTRVWRSGGISVIFLSRLNNRYWYNGVEQGICQTFSPPLHKKSYYYVAKRMQLHISSKRFLGSAFVCEWQI